MLRNEPTSYSVVWPRGEKTQEIAPLAGRLDSLEGKTVGFLWDYLFRGDEIFPLAKERGVGMVVRSVYLKGALTERAEQLPDHLEKLKQISREYRQLTSQQGIDPAQAALRFVLSQDEVSTALVGVRNQTELQLALDAAEAGGLPDDLLAQVTSLRIEEEELLNPGYWGIP